MVTTRCDKCFHQFCDFILLLPILSGILGGILGIMSLFYLKNDNYMIIIIAIAGGAGTGVIVCIGEHIRRCKALPVAAVVSQPEITQNIYFVYEGHNTRMMIGELAKEQV